jgi:hypothetical protein
MTFRDKLRHEVKSVLLATLFFAAWFEGMVALKTLILAGYQVHFSGLMQALVAALVVGKIVLALQHVKLGRWVRRQPAWVDVVLRTLFYELGVFLVLLGEKLFHERHEYDSFSASLVGVFASANANEVWAKVICVGWALFVFNGFAVARQRLGAPALVSLFTAPLEAGETPEHELAQARTAPRSDVLGERSARGIDL